MWITLKVVFCFGVFTIVKILIQYRTITQFIVVEILTESSQIHYTPELQAI